jgi:hypothetical protein
MHTPRWWLPVVGLAATLAMSGCLCGADEQRAVTVSSPDSLTVVGDGATRRIEVVTRLTEPEVSRSTFDFVFNTVERSAGGEGIALSLSGTDPASNELVVLVLALPVSLQRGEAYPVGATFAVEPGVSSDPRLWGPHDLRQPAQAEVAFTVAAYSFPPPQYTVRFRAVTSTGTIRVTQRQRGWVELSLDLSLADATGRARTVTGRVQANSERYTPPCT